MNIGFVTSLRTPYRILQINEFSTNKDAHFNVYYTNKQKENRNWEITYKKQFKEKDLSGFGLFGKYGYINFGLLDIVRHNDVVILGGYEQPSYILICLLCRLFKTPYILAFDGISTDRLTSKENRLKKMLKNRVIKSAKAIFGNGTVSQRYFHEQFGYPKDKIFNQYLTVDHKTIDRLYSDKIEIRKTYRQKLGIQETDKVVLYSGRLLDFKNVKSVVKAMSRIQRNDLLFLITGGGDEEEQIRALAEECHVRLIVTGFITEQEELFKHYLTADVFILPSFIEPWGLVVNEAMIAGLPVILSENCGSSLDLVTSETGITIDPYNTYDITYAIEMILYEEDHEKMGSASRKVISNWTFENSRVNLEWILDHYIWTDSIEKSESVLDNKKIRTGGHL